MCRRVRQAVSVCVAGGLFPPGQPIGVVSSVNDAIARVQPYTDWDRLEFVSVLRYDMPRMNVGAPGP